MTELKTTALHDMHVALDAKMVPFAGYDMPVQYPMGVLQEHLHTRANAGLFDVSHMGQFLIDGPAAALERLLPGDVAALAPMRQLYSVLTNESGGIVDDLMLTRLEGGFFMVVNAAFRGQASAYLSQALGDDARVTALDDRALLALQGPAAVELPLLMEPQDREGVRSQRRVD